MHILESIKGQNRIFSNLLNIPHNQHLLGISITPSTRSTLQRKKQQGYSWKGGLRIAHYLGVHWNTSHNALDANFLAAKVYTFVTAKVVSDYAARVHWVPTYITEGSREEWTQREAGKEQHRGKQERSNRGGSRKEATQREAGKEQHRGKLGRSNTEGCWIWSW